MAKVNTDLKTSSAAARKKQANKAAATPSKTSKGKITKKRLRSKGEFYDHSDYVNRHYDIPSKIRMCFVKMNRDNITQIIEDKNGGSIVEKNCTTNQTIIMHDQGTDYTNRNKSSDSSEVNVFPTLSKLVSTHFSPQSDRNNNITPTYAGNDSFPHSHLVQSFLSDRKGELVPVPKLQLPDGRKCCVKLKKIKILTQNDKDKENLKKNASYKLGKECKTVISPQSNDVTTNITITSCVVRIQKHPIFTQNIETKNVDVYDAHQSPSTFQDNSIRQENKSQTKRYNSNIPIRNCVVNILKLPINIQKDLNNRIAAKESLLASQIISPTLDNEKRKAFQKLSLSFQQKSKNKDISESEAMDYSKAEETPYLEKSSSVEREFNNQNRKANQSMCSGTQNDVKNSNYNNQQKLKRNRTKKNLNEISIEVKSYTKDELQNSAKITKEINIIKSRKKRNVVKEKTSENLPRKKILKNTNNITIGQKHSIIKEKDSKNNIDATMPENRPDKKNYNDELNIFLKPLTPAVKSPKEISDRKHKIDLNKDNDFTTSSILEFHPQRNSTMCAAENLSQLTVTDGCTVNNLEDNVETNFHSLTKNQTKTINKTNKFFHRNDEATGNHLFSSNCKNARAGKKSSLVRREKVYDFLSQSQTSDCDDTGVNGAKPTKPVDPTADIVKKLIAEGKVAVATSKKGTGKTCFKRNIKKPKKDVLKKTNNNKANGIKKPRNNIKNSQKQPITSEDNEYHFEDNNFMDNNERPMEVPLTRHSYLDQEGTFSSLAKTVLINQAKRNDPQRLKAQRLLSMAKKLISTPNNKNIPSIRTTMNVDISPIQSMTTLPRTMTKATPWRVDEDAHMPKVFNFSRSSGNLPSYSSDFIPQTPKKDKTNKTIDKTKTADNILQERKSKSALVLSQEDGIQPLPDTYSTPLPCHSVNSSIPSFSSNDSNAENKTPSGGENLQKNDENANIFNLKQLPNPRRTLNYRSPLKAINITEVVQLPRVELSKILYAKKNLEIETIEESDKIERQISENQIDENLFGFEDLLTENYISDQGLEDPVANGSIHELEIYRINPENQPKEDLFGFEDFLTQNNSSQEEASEINVNITKDTKKILEENRHKLRKLKPDTRELEKSLHQNSFHNAQRTDKILFIDKNHIPIKPQRTLKEMLCSTMMSDKPTTTRKALDEQRNGHMDNETNDSAMLFKDLEPETTFNEDDPHKTYVRPFKRKRRLNENRLIFTLESDESDLEENPKNNLNKEKKKARKNQSNETDTSTDNHDRPNKKKKKNGKNQSHETDTSAEFHAPSYKKEKRQPKAKPELVHFVEEFNEMCKEVENYELIVEKSV